MALKILVAEDDRHTRRILDHIFTKDPAFRDQEVTLFLAPDGEEALKLFEKETPDLVISDLLMPRLDGFALCRAIRRLPAGKDVPVIVTSAIYKETALLNRMRDELGVEFFAKPFQVRELVRGVQRMLEKRQSLGEDDAETEPPPIPKAPEPKKALQGELSERPLATLLFNALEEQSTGVLTLRRGKVKKEIYIILGHPVGSESNIRTENIGHYLVAKGVINENQLQQGQATAKEQSLGLKGAFVKLGWLSETDVLRHHTALVKLKIINSLRWYDGTWSFAPGDTFSERIPKATIDIANIIFLGLQRVTNLDEVSKKLEQVAYQAIAETERTERYQEVFVKVFGGDVLQALPTQPSINELLGKGVEPLKVYLQTHALLECGMAELGAEKQAADAAPPVHTEDPIGLRQLKQEATRVPEPKGDAATDGLLYEEIFGVDEISVVTAMPVPTEAQPAHDSDELAIDIQLDDPCEDDPDKLSPEEARKLVVSTYLGIHEKNYYEILNVPATAPPPQIHDAYRTLADKFKVERFTDCDLGLDHPKLEEISHLHRHAYDALVDPVSRAAYDDELKSREALGQEDAAEAEKHFRKGQELLEQGRHGAAAEEFREALAVDPESPDYHAALAWALFQGDPTSGATQQEALGRLDQALLINPDDLRAHIFYGKICVAADRASEGREHLEKALDLEPANEEAFDALAEAHSGKGDWKLLERQHRTVIHRLANRKPERVVALWKSLAAVYTDKLNDPESARTSLEVALSIAPDDPALAQAIADLDRPDPALWRETAQALSDKHAASPEDAGPLTELFTLYEEVGQHDAAFVTASALVHVGAATEEATTLHRRFQPRFLIRARRDVDAEVWQKLRHDNDDPETGALFEALATLEPDFDFEADAPDDLGAPVALEDHPEAFSRILQYVCSMLALPLPQTHVIDDADEPATLVNPIAPVLVVSRALHESMDPLELGVRLGRLAPYFWAGRAFGLTMNTKQLRAVLMAAMKVVAPKLKVEDPTGAIARINARLTAAPSAVLSQLTEVIHALTKERSSLNITRWMRGVARSADRLALLLGGDLAIALRHLPTSRPPEAIADLLAFSLSEQHLELRERLALSIAV